MNRVVVQVLDRLGALRCLVALPLICGGCGSDGPAPLTEVPLPAWHGAADAGCTIGGSAVTLDCASAYRITGDPYACPGFDDAGSGLATNCEALCKVKFCNLSGLSDGTSAVVCSTDCSAVGEH